MRPLFLNINPRFVGVLLLLSLVVGCNEKTEKNIPEPTVSVSADNKVVVPVKEVQPVDVINLSERDKIKTLIERIQATELALPSSEGVKFSFKKTASAKPSTPISYEYVLGFREALGVFFSQKLTSYRLKTIYKKVPLLVPFVEYMDLMNKLKTMIGDSSVKSEYLAITTDLKAKMSSFELLFNSVYKPVVDELDSALEDFSKELVDFRGELGDKNSSHDGSGVLILMPSSDFSRVIRNLPDDVYLAYMDLLSLGSQAMDFNDQLNLTNWKKPLSLSSKSKDIALSLRAEISLSQSLRSNIESDFEQLAKKLELDLGKVVSLSALLPLGKALNYLEALSKETDNRNLATELTGKHFDSILLIDSSGLAEPISEYDTSFGPTKLVVNIDDVDATELPELLLAQEDLDNETLDSREDNKTNLGRLQAIKDQFGITVSISVESPERYSGYLDDIEEAMRRADHNQLAKISSISVDTYYWSRTYQDDSEGTSSIKLTLLFDAEKLEKLIGEL